MSTFIHQFAIIVRPMHRARHSTLTVATAALLGALSALDGRLSLPLALFLGIFLFVDFHQEQQSQEEM
jgi:hypothetical protein